jgi:hypothetical protein
MNHVLKTTIAIVLTGAAVFGLDLAAATLTAAPVTCTFDGSGTIQAGEAGKTADGKIWVCNADGTLIHVTGYGS